jgi:dienelactone hydrolase
MMKLLPAVLLSPLAVLTCAPSAFGEVQTEVVEYRHGDVVLEGYLAYDDAIVGQQPGVLVVHEWTGIGDYVRNRVEQLAELGYVAFAADIYGKGIRPQNRQEAAAQAQIYRTDRQLWRERTNAGLQVLLDNERVDDNRVAAIGYCFGGGAVLELARSGAPIAGFVSFHGSLDTPDPSDAQNIQGKVLILHGADDPLVPPEQVEAFQSEMRSASVDWQFVEYGGAVHAFSNPETDTDPSDGVAYNEAADRRSWTAMRQFFAEIFE